MRFVKRKLKNQNVSKYLVLVFFVRRKKRKKRHEFLTDVKNDLMLSKSLFEVVKEPKLAPQRASLTTSLSHFHFVISP